MEETAQRYRARRHGYIQTPLQHQTIPRRKRPSKLVTCILYSLSQNGCETLFRDGAAAPDQQAFVTDADL